LAVGFKEEISDVEANPRGISGLHDLFGALAAL
jgi:hypothetical protein